MIIGLVRGEIHRTAVEASALAATSSDRFMASEPSQQALPYAHIAE
jgi:hypothetical protein